MQDLSRRIWKGLWLVCAMLLLAACNEQVAAPTRVSAVGGEGEAIVVWDDVAGAAAYNVSWNATGKATADDTTLASVTSPLVVTGLRNESTYYFRVTAISAVGASAPSQQVTARATAARLQTISITPPTPRMALGTRQYLAATGEYSDGSTQDLSRVATWSSANRAILSVIEEGKGAGRVTAKTAGSAEVSARYRGVVAKTSVTVQTDTLATLTGLIITPNNPYVHPVTQDRSARLAFKALGTFASGFTQDLTATVVWSVAPTGIASIGNALGSEGVARGLTVGATGVYAEVAVGNGSFQTRTALIVTTLDLVSLAIVTPVNSLATGNILDLSAAATFSDGSVNEVGTSVIWSSDNTNVLLVEPAYGRVTGIAPGVANVTASLPGTALKVTKQFTVLPAAPVALRTTPALLEIVPGATQLVSALAVNTDGSTSVIPLTWSSSNSAVALVSNAGLVSAVAPGVALIQVEGVVSAGMTLTARVGVVVRLSSLTAVDHTGVTSDCNVCHNRDMPVGHISTTAQCSVCHTTTAWLPANVDHIPFVNNCVVCHNGFKALGKSGKHNLGLNTSDQCEACHAKSPASWAPIVTLDHTQTTAVCSTCHNGALASGKNPSHVVSSNACDTCHFTTAWKPVR